MALTSKEKKEVLEEFRKIAKDVFAKIGGAVNKYALKRFFEREKDILGAAEIKKIQDLAEDYFHELDRYEHLCRKDPGLYKRWKTAKENLHFVATYE